MGVLTYNYRSEALGMWTDIIVTIPSDDISYMTEEEEAKQHRSPASSLKPFRYVPGMKFQTIYMIHGGGDDATVPYRYTNLERWAQENCVMTVAPSIPNSFGVDTDYGVRYQTYLSEELPKVIQTLFPSSNKREDNFIMGFAMGGNVAFGTALMHPELYAACVDLSGGIGLTLDTDGFKKELDSDHFQRMKLYGSTFGKAENLEGSKYDMYAIAKKNKEAGVPLPKFFLECGSVEFIRARVERDVALLRELDYDMVYICPEGYDHNYYNWDKYFKIAMEEWLPLTRKPIYSGK